MYPTQYFEAILGLGLLVFSYCCQHWKLVGEISPPISIFRFSEVLLIQEPFFTVSVCLRHLIFAMQRTALEGCLASPNGTKTLWLEKRKF